MKKVWGLIILLLIIGLAFPLTQYLLRIQKAFTPDNLIRIHVVANSDSTFDQATKIQVKDRIVEWLSPRLAMSGSVNQSKEFLGNNLETIMAIAYDEIKNNQAGYSAYATVGEFEFPTKSYGELTLPRGKYTALRVVLGEGKGKNWWCVLYPPLCLGQQKASISENKPGLYVAKMTKKPLKRKAASRNKKTIVN
ncbi:MAG: stage II sporulation protein R [Chitinophagales bacterium]